jgi:hypothetical protein
LGIEMFDYPLPTWPACLYDELGLPPEANEKDLREAISTVTARLRAEADSLRTKIDEAVRDVTGGDEADGERHRALAEARAAATQPDFREWCDRRAELERRLNDINAASLDKPDERAKYDARFPPFALLKIAPPRDPFADAATVLMLVRREVSAYLAAQGVPVRHPSDLTRTDFTGDFTANPDLDGD